MDNNQNYYDILEVTPDATDSEIKKAYLRSKNAYGQDSVAIYSLMDAGETERILEKIEEAYHVLSTPEKRRKYDQAHGFLNPEDKDVFDESPMESDADSTDSMDDRDPMLPAHESVTGIAELAGMMDSPTVFDDSSRDGEGPKEKKEPKKTIAAKASEAAGLKRFQIEKYYEKNSEMEGKIQQEEEFRGSFFQKVRSYKKLSIQELSEITKISRNYIQAIEDEDFPNLPATVYVRGFVAQYARTLKLPAEKAASAYIQHVRDARGQNERNLQPPAPPKKKSWWPFG